MAVEIKIPSVGESISEGIVAAWHVKDGEYVEAGTHILDFETDKITEAISHFKNGARDVPFSEEKPYFINALAIAYLKEKDFNNALHIVEEIDKPISNVIKLHAFGELKETIQEITQYRDAAIFLLAYWLYIDGVYTVIRMAVPYSAALGFDPSVPLKGILVVQVIAIPATLGFGWLAIRYGARRVIMVGIAAYFVVTTGAPLMTRPEHFYILAGIIGLAQGGIQSISRSMFARLIPENEAGKYFGFYNMVGRFAAVLGPFLMATMALVFGERLSILAIPVLLILGMILLAKVKDPAQLETT